VTSSHVRRLESRVARTAARFLDYAGRHDLPVEDLPSAKLPWYEIRAGGEDADGQPDTATVLLFDEIGGSFGVDATTFVEELDAITAATIKVRINSPGGSVFDAIAIYNALNHHEAQIVVYVDALAASAASIVAMAGDEVVMMPGSQLMIHDASALEDGNAADMAKMSTFLDRQSENLADLYRRRAGGDTAQWRDLMRAETWMFADEAVESGLADRVEPAPARVADDRMTRSFDLSQFRYAGRRHAPEYRKSLNTAKSRRAAEVGARGREARSTGVAAHPVQQSGRRFGHLSRVEVRTNADGSVHVEGHAAVFDISTWIGPEDWRGFEERIAPGAFKKTISDGADVRFLFNHNPDLVLARSKASTLTLHEDQVGLAVGADLAPTSVGRDLAILLERRDVDQMSFGFQVVKDVWETTKRSDGTEFEVRTIIEARLFDVSAVTYAAYDETDLAIREAQLARELRELRGVPRPKTTGKAEPPEGTPPGPASTTRSPALSGASQYPEPATATPAPNEVRDESLKPLDLILRHAEGAHLGSPRVLCPACTRLEPASATPASSHGTPADNH
jgi:HK97 family phage prohead protease